MARKLRKLFQDNFERRSADWTPEKKARRLQIRQRTFDVLEVVGKVADIPAGGKISAVLNLTDDAIAASVDNPNMPEFTQEVADVLKNPLTRKAFELAQEFIDLIEDEIGIDIPDHLEQRIARRAVDLLADQFDDLAEVAGDKISDLFDAGVTWFKDLID